MEYVKSDVFVRSYTMPETRKTDTYRENQRALAQNSLSACCLGYESRVDALEGVSSASYANPRWARGDRPCTRAQ